jgi:hypothetical protein
MSVKPSIPITEPVANTKGQGNVIFFVAADMTDKVFTVRPMFPKRETVPLNQSTTDSKVPIYSIDP